jgi:hypothetical protein
MGHGRSSMQGTAKVDGGWKKTGKELPSRSVRTRADEILDSFYGVPRTGDRRLALDET